MGGGIENGVKDEREREREQLHVHVHGRRRRDLSARSTPRGRRLVSSRLTKEKEKEAGRRVKGVIYRGKRRAGSSGSGHRCNLATPLHGTVVRSRVYERAASARWCWSAMGARGERGRGREISLRARVHGSRENREPTATAETAPRREPGGDRSGPLAITRLNPLAFRM